MTVHCAHVRFILTKVLFLVMNFFHSLKRMVALVTVFFIPELVEMIGSPMLYDSSFIRKIFWTAVESREKSKETRGDFIDSIIQLKNGKQDPLYSKLN